MIVGSQDIGQRQINCDFLPEDLKASSSIHNDSPLRAFLRSIDSTAQPKGVFSDTKIAPDLFDIASSSTPHRRHRINGHEQERNAMDPGDVNQSSLSLSLHNMDLGGNSRNRKESSSRILSSGKDPDIFIQKTNDQQQALVGMPSPNLPREILLDVNPTPIIPSGQPKQKRHQKGRINKLRKKEEISYDNLNKLMQVTASSRCLLLEQSKKNNSSSVPLLSAFKSIVSSTTITSSTSVASGPKTNETFTTSDCINSSFDDPVMYSKQQQKKRRMESAIDLSLFGSTLKPPGTSRPTATASMNSLPSCGSLASQSSESERNVRQVTQKSSSSFDTSDQMQLTPAAENHVIGYGPTTSLMQSLGNLPGSASLGAEQIQAISSSMAQGDRRFNSFQVPVGRHNRSTHGPNRAFSAGGNLFLHQQGSNSRNMKSSEISHSMKRKLRQELQRTTTKSRFPEGYDNTW
jgi:hypothetical protein